MLSERNFALAASLLIAAGVSLLPTSAVQAQSASSAPSACDESVGLAVLPAPAAPWTGAPLRVMFVTEKPLDGELSLITPSGAVAARSAERRGGPPYLWFAEVATPQAGTWHATLSLGGASFGCGTLTREIAVSGQKPAAAASAENSVWPVRASWNRTTEDLYSAWITKLFDGPPDQDLSWKAWHEVLRDRSRNLLFNYLGMGEDNVAVSLKPDCADFVYFLRAYFAFKMGLPFGYSNCSRGMAGSPPKCYQWFDIMHPSVTRPSAPPEQVAAATPAPTPADPPQRNLLQKMFAQEPSAPPPVPAAPAAPAAPKRLGLAPSFGQYLRAVGDVVHTGSVRVSATDDNTDFYMVPLTQETLRPGTVYADPYGHVLMLVTRIPEVNGTPGVYLAVDAEPDGTVTRKRFWRGNFLFAHDPALGSPGFKRFRPIVRAENGALRRLTNAEIAKNPSYGDFSLEQTKLSLEDFYDRMDEVMSPDPLDPAKAMADAITSLEQQVNTRVTAVENGRKFQSSGKGDASMPDGASIFETNGPWEDFSTPARDLRLLIAIDVVRGFPDRVARLPQRYAIPFGKSVAGVKAELQGALASELAARKVTYTRSDGSPFTLTLKDVLDRASDLEMAYNPNDCVELRWGAPQGSDEASTCKRHAPAAQRAKMSDYRSWFHERHWPTHTGA